MSYDKRERVDILKSMHRLVKVYACKSGYCVSNRSGTNCKVSGAPGGKANANRKV